MDIYYPRLKNKQFYIGTSRVEASKWNDKISYVEDGCNSSKCFKGWGPDLFHLMQKDLNFTYTILSRDDAVGRRLSNGSYTGILG